MFESCYFLPSINSTLNLLAVMVVEEVINCDCNAYDELKGLYFTAVECRKKDKAFNAEILKAFEYYIANEQEFLRLIDEEVKAVRERRNKQRIE